MPDRRLGVVIAADVAGFIRGLRDAGSATKTLGADIDQLSVSTKAGADAQVAATVKKTARLRDEVTAYRAVAAAAETGSDEQVAATNLAIRAQSRLADSLGVTASEARRLSVSTAGVGSDIDRAGRGALAGAGAFSGLGRSVAFASTWFLGGVGFISGAKGAVNAASDLDEQIQRTSSVFGGSAAAVKGWSTTSVQAMGLSRAAALDAADTIGTLLQNVGETPAKGAAMSQTFVQLASDMAAFKKVDPNVSLNALESGLAGRTKSLKNFGLVLDTTTIKAEALSDGILKSSVDLGKVRDLEAKVNAASSRASVATTVHGAGSAQAVTATLQLHDAQNQLAKAIGGTTGQLTAQQRTLAIYNLILKQTSDQRGAFAADSDQLTIKEEKFHAALTDTEAAIGNALLPTVSKYVGELGTWLSSSQNQAKVQKDVTEAVNAGVTILHIGADALRVITTLTGGFKNALELLIALKFANAVAGWSTGLANYGTSLKVAAAETTGAAAVIETDTAAIGATAVATTAEVGGLRAALLGLGAPEVLAALAAVAGAELFSHETTKVSQKVFGETGFTKLGTDKEGRQISVKNGKFDAGDTTDTGKYGFHLGGSLTKAQAAKALGMSGSVLEHLVKTGTKAKTPAVGTVGTAPGAVSGGSAATPTSIGASGTIPLTKAQQLSLALAKSPDDVALLKAKESADDAAIADLNKRRDAGKVKNATYLQEMTGLYNDRASTEAQIQTQTTKAASTAKKQAKLTATVPLSLQVQQAMAAITPDTADDVKAAGAIKRWAENLIKTEHLKGQALIDALGDIATANQTLGQFQIPMDLQIKAAKAGITQTESDDVAAAKQIKAFTEAQIKSRKLQGQALIDAYNTISQENSIIGAAPSKSVKLVTGADVTKGLKLTRAQRIAVEQRYDQAAAHGGRRPTGVGVLGQTVVLNNPTFNGIVDVPKFASELDKRTRRRVVQSRGHNAGHMPH